MTAGPMAFHPLLAVHISDGVLTWPWLAGGFVLAGVLAAVAMIRVRDEEIPRIALMTAAFFVASLIHVPIGPTSVHLLLNGLLGVVVGRRAPLAVLLGLTLQAVLLGHGGFTTIGVNTCVMALPALGAAWLFGVLRAGTRWPWFRSGLVAVSVLTWTLCLAYSVALLMLSRSSGMSDIAWWAAAWVAFNPFNLVISAILAAAVTLMERRLRHPSEFPAGLFVGMMAVLATLALNAAALLWGGAEDWHSIVLLVFVVHMPIAVAEGVILGFAVGFLTRVKPEMLGGLSGDWAKHWRAPTSANGAITADAPGAVTSDAAKPPTPAGVTLPPPALLLFAVLGVLWAAGPAHAHRLEADYRVRPNGQVQVESWFDVGGKAPAGAKVQVLRPNGDVLAEGALDERGIFVFAPTAAEDLKVVVYAGAGHRAEFTISQFALPKGLPAAAAKPAAAAAPPTPMIDRTYQIPYKEILAGFGFLLGLAAFILSLRNMRQLQELKRAQEQVKHRTAPADDRHFSAGKTSSSGTSH
jgi:cobalt/nickel transport system permease protein